MAVLSYAKLRIVVAIFVVFLIWQMVRCLPWFQSLNAKYVDHGPGDNGMITPVSVSVYYEALCPDSKSFILKHLLPTIEKASRLLTLTLIPYGKAKTEEDSTGVISFSCQHGPIECLANKVHACGISLVPDSLLQVKYVACMITDNMNPQNIGKKCAEEFNIDWEPILKCSTSLEGSILLKTHGEATHSLHPSISFVPTVLLDDSHKNQAAILKNFFKELCAMFSSPPEECIGLTKTAESIS